MSQNIAAKTEQFPIAIIGIGCRLPGADSLEEYRKILIEKAVTYSEYSTDRWVSDEWHTAKKSTPGRTCSNVGGQLDNVHGFDSGFFNMSPKESLSMDTQQGHLLEVTQLAMDDAGVRTDQLPENTAVYVSMKMAEQTMMSAENLFFLNQYILTGGAHTVCANRINFFYDIRGPSMGVEGSCTSAASSVHFGLWSLWRNECDMSIVGGVSYVWAPQITVMLNQAGVLSPSGKASPFDTASDGQVRSDGCGVLLLKPLHKALRDGNHIHAILKGSVLGHNGSELGINTYTEPSIVNVVDRVFDQFPEINKESVDYVEAYAPGNSILDGIEARSLGKIYGSPEKPIAIGSCKANLGHMESAASMGSIYKAVLMVENREFYPQANYSDETSDARFPALNSPCRIAEDNCVRVQAEYDRYTGEKPMRVAVNSLSFSGQVSHMIIEEYNNPEVKVAKEDEAGWCFGDDRKGCLLPVPLSAKAKGALKDLAKSWLSFENKQLDARRVVGWLATKREHFPYRLVILANSSEDFRRKVNDYVNGDENPDVMEGIAPVNFADRPLCFVMPGQGQQWWGMGRQLYASEPVYKNIVDQCDAVWKKNSGYSFLEEKKIFVSEGYEHLEASSIDEIINCQPAILSHQMALITLMRHWGVEADMCVGHSLGEVAAAYGAGGMTLEECMTSIYVRATSQTKLSGTGAMAAARLDDEEGEKFCNKFDNLYIACHNAPGSLTLAGSVENIDKIVKDAPRSFKRIAVKAAFHTVNMRPVRQDFYDGMKGKYVSKLTGEQSPVIYSTVTGAKSRGPFDLDYWWDNLEKRVRFTQATVEILKDYTGDKQPVFVEIGSMAVLLSCVRKSAQSLQQSAPTLIPAGAKDKCDYSVALRAVAALHFLDYPIKWDVITRNCATYVALPIYPFQHTWYLKESKQQEDRRLGNIDKSFRGRSGEITVLMQHYLSDISLDGEHFLPASGLIEYLTELDNKDISAISNICISRTNRTIVDRPDVIGRYERRWVKSMVDGNRVQLFNTENKSTYARQHNEVVATAVFSRPRPLDPTHATTHAIPNQDALKSRLPKTSLIGQEFYGAVKAYGLQYGDDFRRVEELYTDGFELLAYIHPSTNRHERLHTLNLECVFMCCAHTFSPSKDLYQVSRVNSLQMFTKRVSEVSFTSKRKLMAYAKLVQLTSSRFVIDIIAWMLPEEGEEVTAEFSSPAFRLTGVTFERVLNTVTSRTMDNPRASTVRCLKTPLQVSDTMQNPEQFAYIDTKTEVANQERYKEAEVVYSPGSRRDWTLDAQGTMYGVDVSSTPAHQQLRVRVHAVYENYMSGVIEAKGPGCDDFKVGDNVICLNAGVTVATVIDCHSSQCCVRPKSIDSHKTAAAWSLTYATAIHTINSRLQITSGQTLAIYCPGDNVIENALLKVAGKLGIKTVLVSAQPGCEVVTSTSTPEVDAHSISLQEDIRAANGGHNVDFLVVATSSEISDVPSVLADCSGVSCLLKLRTDLGSELGNREAIPHFRSTMRRRKYIINISELSKRWPERIISAIKESASLIQSKDLGVEFSDLNLAKPLDFNRESVVALRLQFQDTQVPVNKTLQFPIFKARGVDGTYLVYLSSDKNNFGMNIDLLFWLYERGARNIAIMYCPLSDTTLERKLRFVVSYLQRRGVNVYECSLKHGQGREKSAEICQCLNRLQALKTPEIKGVFANAMCAESDGIETLNSLFDIHAQLTGREEARGGNEALDLFVTLSSKHDIRVSEYCNALCTYRTERLSRTSTSICFNGKAPQSRVKIDEALSLVEALTRRTPSITRSSAFLVDL